MNRVFLLVQLNVYKFPFSRGGPRAGRPGPCALPLHFAVFPRGGGLARPWYRHWACSLCPGQPTGLFPPPSTALVWLPKRGSWFQVYVDFTVSGTWPFLVQWPGLHYLRCTVPNHTGLPRPPHLVGGPPRYPVRPGRRQNSPFRPLGTHTKSHSLIRKW